MDRELLFHRNSLSEMINAMPHQVDEKLHKEKPEYLLNVNEEVYIQHLICEFTIDALSIDTEHTEIAKHYEKDVEQIQFERRYRVKKNYITFAIPFTGERELFFYQPSTFDYNPPRAIVTQNNELKITVQSDGGSEGIKIELNSTLESINKYLSWQRNDIDKWNQALPVLVRTKFKDRKSKLLKDAGIVESLGFPLRKHEGTPSSYTVPCRKKIVINRPTAKNKSYKPHPKIDDQVYQEILNALRNMALVIERSPSAFEKMGEENIRMHFLVNLNGFFDGMGTGETFNYEGKTDILLRQDGRNIFIAECKFWTGARGFTQTIDQLLNYLTWRDSKSAIIVFVRNTAMSTVLNKIPGLLQKHPQFLSKCDNGSSDEFRVRMKSLRDDALTHLVTVQLYHIPSNKKD